METVQLEVKPPSFLETYINSKLEKKGGRKHLVQKLGRERFLSLLADIYLRNKTPFEIAEVYGTTVPTIYRVLKELEPHKTEVVKEIEEYFKAPRLFWNRETETSIYYNVQRFINYAKAYNLKEWRKRLRYAERVWEALGRKDPANWSIDEVMEFLQTVPNGSKYKFIIAIRTVAPHLTNELKTKGMKTPPRKLPILRMSNFPELWEKIIERAKELARDERERDEIELILRVKSLHGIRTGRRSDERELWGTRIAKGKSALYLNEKTGEIIWEVYAKQDERWTITVFSPLVKRLLFNFVKKYQLKPGDWLISMSDRRANELLGKASEEICGVRLRLHDCRKIFITFLKRAGVSIEDVVSPTCSCPFGVTWKDANTAYKHYLEVVDIDQINAYNRFVETYGLR